MTKAASGDPRAASERQMTSGIRLGSALRARERVHLAITNHRMGHFDEAKGGTLQAPPGIPTARERLAARGAGCVQQLGSVGGSLDGGKHGSLSVGGIGREDQVHQRVAAGPGTVNN